jgi:hypothetical protein
LLHVDGVRCAVVLVVVGACVDEAPILSIVEVHEVPVYVGVESPMVCLDGDPIDGELEQIASAWLIEDRSGVGRPVPPCPASDCFDVVEDPLYCEAFGIRFGWREISVSSRFRVEILVEPR